MASRDDNLVRFRRPRNPQRKPRQWTRAGDYGAVRRPWWTQFTPVMVVVPLAAFAAVLLWPSAAPGVPQAAAASFGTESARFTICGGGPRVNCVIDGDTFWYRGEKIRVADINTPEVSRPECAAEARLGAQATGRLQALLNAGPFSLEPIDRDRDRYGRLLRTVTRGGESLGLVLVDEGLAEQWQGSRGSWC